MSYSERPSVRRGPPSNAELKSARAKISEATAKDYYNLLVANKVSQVDAALQTARLFELPQTNFALAKKMETIDAIALIKDEPKQSE